MDRRHVIALSSPRRRLAVTVAAGAVLACLISTARPQAGAAPRVEAQRPSTRPVAAAASTPATRPALVPPDARIVEDGWFAPIAPRVPRPALNDPITNAYVIPIHGEINSTMADAFDRKAGLCRGKGAQIVILDLDTPGGAMDAMERITKTLSQDLGGIYKVAFVDADAFSAGAVISLACNEIVMTPPGKIGAAMPISVGPGGIAEIPKKVQEKFESAARSIVRALAESNGYDPLICEGMVGSDISIWLIRNQKTGQLKFVKPYEWSGLSGAPAATSQPTAGRGPLPEPGWEYVRTVDGSNELVSATAQEAVFMGLARQVLPSMAALREHFHITAEPTVLGDTWSEELVAFLTSPAITGILLMIVVFGAYMEFHTPGFGVAGTVAIIALALLLGSRYLIGMAVWWEIALLVLGLVLLFVEIFITPGFGVLGFTGILMCVVALIAILVDNPPDKLPIPDTDLGWEFFSSGLMALGIGFLAAIAAIIVVAKYLPKVPVAGRLMLVPPPPDAPQTMPVETDSPLLAIHVGDAGVVTSICRPVGQVRIGDKLVDAETEGEFVPAGAQVRVIKKEGNRIVIEQTGTRD